MAFHAHPVEELFAALDVCVRPAEAGRYVRGGLLLREHRTEDAFDDVELGAVTGGIDVRIRSLAELRELLVHAVHPGMRAERDVGTLRAEKREAALELLDDLRRVGVADEFHARIDADTADDEHAVALPALRDVQRPRRAAPCVPRREMRDE